MPKLGGVKKAINSKVSTKSKPAIKSKVKASVEKVEKIETPTVTVVKKALLADKILAVKASNSMTIVTISCFVVVAMINIVNISLFGVAPINIPGTNMVLAQQSANEIELENGYRSQMKGLLSSFVFSSKQEVDMAKVVELGQNTNKAILDLLVPANYRNAHLQAVIAIDRIIYLANNKQSISEAEGNLEQLLAAF